MAADVMQRADVRVVQAGDGLRLALEPGQAVRVIREGVGEDLQRDLAVELRVGGLPHLPHPALAKQISDVIVTETGAGV